MELGTGDEKQAILRKVLAVKLLFQIPLHPILWGLFISDTYGQGIKFSGQGAKQIYSISARVENQAEYIIVSIPPLSK